MHLTKINNDLWQATNKSLQITITGTWEECITKIFNITKLDLMGMI